MKNLYIIGAGGCGREILQWAKDVNEVEQKWKLCGFIDDDFKALDNKICDMKVISTIDDFEVKDNDEFICAIGNSTIRQIVVEKMINKGASFTTIIHPNAVVADSCSLGEGVVVYPYALISDNAIVGSYSIINMYSSIAHDSILGEYCTISAHCDVTGNCKLGKRVFMGTTSNMVPSTKIDDDVYICAGSTVMTRVRQGKKVIGNPAKIINF